MALREEVQEQIVAYLESRNSLDDLHYWLADHVQEIADVGDCEGRELADRAWILIAEFDAGHRDEDGVRDALTDLPPARQRSE